MTSSSMVSSSPSPNLVAIANGSNLRAGSSVDGLNWRKKSTGNNGNTGSVSQGPLVYWPGQNAWLYGGYAFSQLTMISRDGTSFQGVGPMMFSSGFEADQALCFTIGANNRIIAAGADIIGGSTIDPYAYYIDDINATSWERVQLQGALPIGEFAHCIDFDGTNLAVISEHRYIASSQDNGVTWTNRQNNSLAATGNTMLKVGGGKWLGSGTTGEYFYSADSITWSRKVLPGLNGSFRSAAYSPDSGLWIAIDQSGVAWLTSDISNPASWSSNTPPSAVLPNSSAYYGGTFVFGGYVAGGGAAAPRMLATQDGTNWQEINISNTFGTGYDYVSAVGSIKVR